MILESYIVGQGDTLEILAQKLLGDWSQANILSQINQLRYPYISDNPADQFANAKGNLFLTHSHTDTAVLDIDNPNTVNILPYDTVYLAEGNANVSVVVQSVNSTTITLESAIQGTFDQAAIVVVFTNQQNIRSKVLKTGDTLYYPVQTDQTDAPISYSLLFGTDWKLDQKGFLMRDGQDMAKVSGLDNLAQALRNRLVTPLGGLILHPDYGNELFSVLGEAAEPYFRGLTKLYTQECLSKDSRVNDITLVDLIIREDAVIINYMVQPIGSQEAINQSITVPIGGVT